MNPNTPSGNQNAFFGTKVSIPGIDVNNAGDNQLILKDDYNSRVYYNSSGIPTVLLGLRSSTSPPQQGLFVSQDGVDVTQASDSQLIFNSNQNIFKIVEALNMEVTFNNAGGSNSSIDVNQTIAHDLGYIPAFNAFITLDAGIGFSDSATNYPNPAIPWLTGSTGAFIGNLIGVVTVDEVNVYFDIVYVPNAINPGGPYTCTATVYLLQETF